MKISRYAIVFIFIVLALSIPLYSRVYKFGKASDRKVMYNKILDDAIDTAVDQIVSNADMSFVDVDREKCVSSYYKALYAGFAAIDSEMTQSKLEYYTPVLAFIDIDGVYFYYSVRGNDQKLKKIWSEKTPYVYEGTVAYNTVGVGNSSTSHTSNYSITFLLNDEILISVDGETFEGTLVHLRELYGSETGNVEKDNQYAAIRAILNSHVLSSDGYYQLTRSECITNTVMERINYYVNIHNELAAEQGESYTFTVPVTAKSDISRATDSVSFMSFFQGYPLGKGTDDVYSNFELSGARIVKNQGYYTKRVIKNGSSILYYHRPSCPCLNSEDTVLSSWFATKEEAASSGAMPCEECKP